MNTNKTTKRRGAAMVEMALVAPVLLLLTFGILQYGWLFLKDAEISNAARIAVRQAVTPGVTIPDQVTGPGSITSTFLANAGIYNAMIYIPTGVTPGTGNPVTVTVVVSIDDVAFPGLYFLPLPSSLSATLTMAKEGPYSSSSDDGSDDTGDE